MSSEPGDSEFVEIAFTEADIVSADDEDACLFLQQSGGDHIAKRTHADIVNDG